ncbi:metallopeptidase [Aliidongia dinghuensis]|uniref:Metallopeptidase n=1 Tax=Aliidongia dinghuensis TaxID=1867774 RepID=A0A8J3E139_9PROT|nr:M13 family metallopeptidase [Aliidongia dinghuensis]GGF07890.1 metallopeptidase [Aliidongia dinghuensis]
MRRSLLLPALILASVSTAASAQAVVPTAEDGLMVGAIDPAVSPCQDFYAHACNGWLKANPIPPDQTSWDADSQLVESNRAKLKAILERAAADPTPATKRIGDYWAACMDESAIEAKGIEPLRPELDGIAAVTERRDLAPLVAHLHLIGTDVLFSFGSDQDFRDATKVIAEVDQAGLGLPDRDYYLKKGKEADQTRAAYVAHVERLFELLGEPAAQAARDADTVMAFETALARASLSTVRRRDPSAVYHKGPRSELDRLVPDFDWAAYLLGVGSPDFDALNVAAPDFLAAVERLLVTTPVEDVKTYLRAHLLAHAADMLPARFVEESFDFYGRTLTGAKELRPRWKRCVGFTDGDLGEDLGRIYVEDAFGAEGKARILALVKNLKAAFAQDIAGLGWMGAETKQKALHKLEVMAEKIGYPDKWRDYSALEIQRDDALGNRFRGATFEFRRQLAKIDKPVDKDEWYMSPPTVNAYYDDQRNDINFPAGILQPPNFDAHWDDAINYGAIGATIGHEMTHGFDDSGRLFDADGNLANWWTKKDAANYHARSECIAREYAGFSPLPGVKLDGHLTLGENTADNGGTRLALMALRKALAAPDRNSHTPQKIDGYTPDQRFFLAYAQSWCTNQTPASARLQALTDPHSTASFRVNGVVANMPEFAHAFSCRPGTPMAPAKSCRVW